MTSDAVSQFYAFSHRLHYFSGAAYNTEELPPRKPLRLFLTRSGFRRNGRRRSDRPHFGDSERFQRLGNRRRQCGCNQHRASVANPIQVETASTQMGGVVTAATMTAVALNGRSYTDLLALQPGIIPVSTQTPDSIVMQGASIAISPSGALNPGNQSISGQREDANGFIVNII
jgi:hypothetical protein